MKWKTCLAKLMKIDLLAAKDQGVASDIRRGGGNERLRSHAEVLLVPLDTLRNGLHRQNQMVETLDRGSARRCHPECAG